MLLLAAAAAAAEREFKAVLGERNRIAREIHDTLAQGYVGISVQLGGAGGTAAAEQSGSSGAATGSDARPCARGAGRRAAVDLGAAVAGFEREDAAGAAAAHDREAREATGWRRSFDCTARIGRCRRERSRKSCAWPRKPSIM